MLTRREMLRWMERGLIAAAVSGSCFARAAGSARQVDLAVYGATPSGIMTAVAAARAGLEVVLIEPSARVGGMVTGGLGLTDVENKKIIGGLTLSFFRAIEQTYGSHAWNLEPHIGLKIFEEMLREAKVVVLRGLALHETKGVRKSGTTLQALQFEDGNTLEARIFADCTYEGDLLAQAGVRHRVGRESSAEFGESWAGVRSYPDTHHVQLSPFDANGKLLPEIAPAPLAELGSGDNMVMAYAYRLCLTNDAKNRVSFPQPPGYDPGRYALLARLLQHQGHPNLKSVTKLSRLPNGKFDLNNQGFFSMDYMGGSLRYPKASHKERESIAQQHYNYNAGFLYFLSNDPSVPADVRAQFADFGLAKDEFIESHNWPTQLYVREARRMEGVYTMTQKDVTVDVDKEDSIGMGSYTADSHDMQRVVIAPNLLELEGGMYEPVEPYSIPYRSILPKPEDASNLLVPVCVSASHVAFCTIRMEPQWMILGEAAGIAAAQALRQKTPLHHLDIKSLTSELHKNSSVLSRIDFVA